MNRPREKGGDGFSSSSSNRNSKNLSGVKVDQETEKDADNKGIFRVRDSPSRLTPNTKQELLATLGVSSDSTEPETISVDLPTITVSEDDLHDSFSDLDTESDADLEDLEKIGREMAASSPCDIESTESPATVSSRKPPPGPSSRYAVTTSSDSLNETSVRSPSRSHSIREKVKQLGGKVKNVSGRVKGMIVNNLRRSHDDVSSIATRSSSPTTSAATMVSRADESSVKLELKKKELDLKKKEKELKQLEAEKKKEEEKSKKLRKDEEDKLAKWEQELKKKEKETLDRIKAKEELLHKREKEIADREANLRQKQNDFEIMCRKVESKLEAERKALANKDGISLRASSPSYETTEMVTTARVSGSVSQLNIDEPNKPPRSVGAAAATGDRWSSKQASSSTAAAAAAAADDVRRRLPPPPRPPLPPPVTTSVTSPTTSSSSPFTKQEPIYARILPKPPKASQVSSSVSQASSHDTSMKTALSAPYSHNNNQSSTLFRMSPASSNESTLYCSDFVDIPLDDDATLRGSFTNHTFDPATFYRMIVTRWRATHPRRILKETAPPRASNRSPIYANLFSRRSHNRSTVNVAGAPVTRRPVNAHSSKRGVSYYSNPPSRQPIYQVVNNSPGNNYRLQRRKQFYIPMEENAYDELIFPIGSHGLETAGPAISFYHQPLPPPRVRRNKGHHIGTQYGRLSPSSRGDVITPIPLDTDCSTTGGGYSLPTTTTGSSSSLNALMVSEDESRETITN